MIASASIVSVRRSRRNTSTQPSAQRQSVIRSAELLPESWLTSTRLHHIATVNRCDTRQAGSNRLPTQFSELSIYFAVTQW